MAFTRVVAAERLRLRGRVEDAKSLMDTAMEAIGAWRGLANGERRLR